MLRWCQLQIHPNTQPVHATCHSQDQPVIQHQPGRCQGLKQFRDAPSGPHIKTSLHSLTRFIQEIIATIGIIQDRPKSNHCCSNTESTKRDTCSFDITQCCLTRMDKVLVTAPRRNGPQDRCWMMHTGSKQRATIPHISNTRSDTLQRDGE